MGSLQQNTKYKYLMSLGHFCSDINQGALSAVLPFLIAAHGYSYATAASLVMISNLVGSAVQPLIGYLSDKRSTTWAIPVGVLMAGSGIASDRLHVELPRPLRRRRNQRHRRLALPSRRR